MPNTFAEAEPTEAAPRTIGQSAQVETTRAQPQEEADPWETHANTITKPR